jgi:DNA-binding transcriptional regulator YiaG
MNKLSYKSSRRIKLDANTSKGLILQVKKEQQWTWKQFADYLNISSDTLRENWKNAKTTIPEDAFRLIKNLSKKSINCNISILPAYWGQGIGKKSKHDSQLKFPPLSSNEFAEFYGAMIGDGCIYKNMDSICITCNGIKDKEYVIIHLNNLCKLLFNIEPRIYPRKEDNTIRLVLNSRKITRFFANQGFPCGKKYEKLRIPKQFFKSSRLLSSCLRGIFDTDGGVFVHPHTRIMMEIRTYSKTLANSIKMAFKKLNLNVSKSQRIQLYGINKVKNFFDIVGSNNPRNLEKYFTITRRNTPNRIS